MKIAIEIIAETNEVESNEFNSSAASDAVIIALKEELEKFTKYVEENPDNVWDVLSVVDSIEKFR